MSNVQLPSMQRTFLESVVSTSDQEGRFIEVNGTLTYYKIVVPQNDPNDQNKPVILLLHHILGNLYTWRNHMRPLADTTGCHVIAYDRPAFGFTERLTSWEEGNNPYTQQSSVDFAVQLVINLGYEGRKIAIIAVSGGGGISCGVAIKHPNLVHSLCLLAPSIRPGDQGPPPIGRHILGSAPGRLFIKIALYRYLPITLFYHDANSIPDWETIIRPTYRVPLTLPNFFESFSWLMKYFTPLEILPNKNILTQIPILYISGDDDRYVHVDQHKEVFDEIASAAPQDAKIEFKVIDECGHLPQDEKPEEVLNHILNFYSRVGI